MLVLVNFHSKKKTKRIGFYPSIGWGCSPVVGIQYDSMDINENMLIYFMGLTRHQRGVLENPGQVSPLDSKSPLGYQRGEET